MKSSPFLNDIDLRISHVCHLLDVVADLLLELDFGKGEERSEELDRVNALVNIGAGDLRRILTAIEDRMAEKEVSE